MGVAAIGGAACAEKGGSRERGEETLRPSLLGDPGSQGRSMSVFY
jgi:hypothetical protein